MERSYERTQEKYYEKQENKGGEDNMEREVSIIVIEDDREACKRFQDIAETMDKISVAACTSDSDEGVELVKQYMPDAVILDLELNEGRGSGMDFLTMLDKADIPYKPFVVVTSNNSSKMIVEYVRSLEIGYYVSKHKEDYSEKAVLDMLVSMKDTIQGSHKKVDKVYDDKDSEEKKEKRIRRMITNELDLVGISPKAIGYDYLTEAIYLLINGEDRPLPAVIGEKYKKTDSSVERAMQNAINKAWRVNDTEELLENYKARIDPRRGNPTLTEFVYYYAKKIKEM